MMIRYKATVSNVKIFFKRASGVENTKNPGRRGSNSLVLIPLNQQGTAGYSTQKILVQIGPFWTSLQSIFVSKSFFVMCLIQYTNFYNPPQYYCDHAYKALPGPSVRDTLSAANVECIIRLILDDDQDMGLQLSTSNKMPM